MSHSLKKRQKDSVIKRDIKLSTKDFPINLQVAVIMTEVKIINATCHSAVIKLP